MKNVKRKPNNSQNKQRGKNNRNHNRGPQKSFTPKPKTDQVREIEYEEGITVGDLAKLLNRNVGDLIKVLFMLGNMVTINSSLDDEAVQLICMEYNVVANKKRVVDLTSLEDEQPDDPASLKLRPAIVTIMGHVDHGKTTLLDAIRKTKVVEGEFGGITQHIGAYQVSVRGRKVTFLDTPGHEAFTQMRARGAKTTDIVIVVVAADDGVMPQTKEAIDHARAAGVPILVAINKMDKPDINLDRIYGELADLGVVAEEWGGDTVFCKISAKQGTGIPELLEALQLLAEMQDLKANPDRLATGTVIEARLDKGRGPVATLLVQNGTLTVGDALVVGDSFGRVRRMHDDRGKEIKHAGPSTPVEIIGLDHVPVAGDLFRAFAQEKVARDVATMREQKRIVAQRRANSTMSLDDLAQRIKEGDVQEIAVILKSDVQGSAEAVKSALENIDVEGVRVNVIRSTAGAITESDVMLAVASNAVIIGFNVRPNAIVRKKAQEEGIEIRLYNIIYKAVEDMEAAMKGMLAPKMEEVIYGQAEVRKLYKVSKVGTIAGCMVTDGKMIRDARIRLIRNGVVAYEGKLGSLKRFQSDAKEVAEGYECGLTVENYNDLKEGDIIEAYGDQEVVES